MSYGYRYGYIVYIKTDDIYIDISEVIGLMKNELDGKIMTKFVGLKAKTYSHLLDEGSEDKKVKSTKKYVMKRKLKFKNYKNCLEATHFENKMNYLEK